MNQQEIDIRNFNETNFRIWQFRITTAVEKLGLQEYLEKDVVKQIESTGNKDEIIKAKKENASVRKIIINSIDDDILKNYLNDNSSFIIMERLRRKNGGSQIDLRYWIKKMNSLKAKNLSEVTSVIDEMYDIFELIKENKLEIANYEKVKFMYNSMP